MSVGNAANIFQQKMVLEERAHQLATSLANLRANLNKYLPIFSLPPELLESIFGICVQMAPSYHNRPSLAWTQVCRHWRQVALTSPRLWQRIDISCSRLASEYLIRSDSALLSIVSNSPRRHFNGSLTPHAHRLHKIEVLLFYDDMLEFLSSLGPELPNLSSLSLAVQQGSRNLVLDARFPCMQFLSLDGVAINWKRCFGLKHLSLRRLDEEHSPSISQLLSILADSPSLKVLRIENIHPAESILSPTTPTVMSHLHSLALFDISASATSYLLTNAVLNPDSHLGIRCLSAIEAVSVLADSIGALQIPSRRQEASLRLTRWSLEFLQPSAHPWSAETLDTSLSIAFMSSWPSPITLISHITSQPSLLTILELGLGVIYDTSKETTSTFLHAVPHLRVLRVALNELRFLLPLLSHSVDSPSGVLCSHLEEISFGRPGETWYGFMRRWLPEVTALARARMQSLPLKVMSFTRCEGMNSEALTKLNPFVDEVIATCSDGLHVELG